ncbi:energy-coupling factor ABC transporter permease [Microbacterium sp. K24]|uniref:energy-coupling factor ABC transporter permease n=1 Tax=Microbacterium sp. K24 TaxID=2305446 RepID=UPI00109C4E07|nr:energy-coupling factor ABC transporter permease [Microbacterium sp. K24]
MHTPDGLLDHTTEISMGLVAAGALTVALARAPREFTAVRGPAYIGAVAAAVFAGQMMNFPVASGTSGHLIGGVLAAVLIGPWTAMICMAIILTVQAVVFADGGIGAVGVNYFLMGIVAVGVGWALFRLVARALPRRTWAAPVAAGIGAYLSVPAAALGFSAIYALGGVTDVDPWMTTHAMVGWHLLIGIGEALITATAVAALMAWQPQLVRGAGVVRRHDVAVFA